MVTKKACKLDVKAVIEHFGGAGQVARLLTINGYDPLTKNAVEKWRERDAIPTKHLVNLQWLARDMKRAFVMSQFIRRTEFKEAA